MLFILGGTRSGKSKYAEKLAKSFNKEVVYIATFPAGDDPEMTERIKRHRRMRPKYWRTIELGNIDKIIGELKKIKNSVVVIECLTILVSNLLLELNKPKNAENIIINKMRELTSSMKDSDNVIILVSNEVGHGVVPGNELARSYRDILGKVNQLAAESSDEFYVMFAGVPVEVKKLGKSGT